MYVLPDAEMREVIIALETDVNLFPAGMTLRLYTNNLIPGPTNVLADFTEATAVEIPGYAPATPAWLGLPTRAQDGSWNDNMNLATFLANAPPPAPQIVYGWFLTDAAKTKLVGSGAFAQPFTFTRNGDGFNLEGLIHIEVESGTDYKLRLDMEQE